MVMPISSAASQTGVVGPVRQRPARSTGWAGRRRPRSRARRGPAAARRPRPPGPASGAWPRRRAGAGRRRSSRPASRCRRAAMATAAAGSSRQPRSRARSDGKSTAWSMPSASMSARRATGSDPPGCASSRGRNAPGRRSRARAGQRAERHGQDLGVAHHDVLVAVGVGLMRGPVLLGQAGPGRRAARPRGRRRRPPAGARRERQRSGRRPRVTSPRRRQSSPAGSGWRNSAAALPPATARSSSSGRCPRSAASTRWVSGQVESAWG